MAIVQNKYATWYFNIISNAKNIKIPGKTELHHILPVSIYPEFSNLRIYSWNGVNLTFKEHYICHRLLTKMFTGQNKSKMMYALVRMYNGKKEYNSILNSRVYKKIKEQYKDFHWSNFKSNRDIKKIYSKRGNQSDNFAGAQKWYNSLSKDEQKNFHKRQGERRCKGWWISKKTDPENEVYVLNLREWCDENNVDLGRASSIANPKSEKYAKSTKGWRIRKDGDPKLPDFGDSRTLRYKEKI
jgi:hypothetical protein